MRVSKRYAAVLTALVAGVLSAAATASDPNPTPPSPAPSGHGCCQPPPPPSSCCTHGTGPIINTPSVHVGGPSVYVGGSSVNVGGVNVNSSLNITVNAMASASASAVGSGGGGGFGRGSGGGNTIIYAGGGGGAYIPPAVNVGGAVTGLRLAGGQSETRTREEQRTRWREEWRVVRAVCVDDTGTPHPASRPDPDERVDANFEGEIFRCMAGTAMQTTIGWRHDGVDSFQDGQTIVCEKGEALRHSPGGRLYCATEEARRNCNERSLLRMYGPGVKLIYYRYEESYTETVEETVSSSSNYASASSMTLMLNGGVGGY